MCLAHWNSPALIFQALRLPLQVRLATRDLQADNTSAGTMFALLSRLDLLAVVVKHYSCVVVARRPTISYA